MVSIKLTSVCHKSWQCGEPLWQYGAVCQGACLCGLIACIGRDWHCHCANLSFLLLWLTVWPVMCPRFRQPLHSLHTLLYCCQLKIDEGSEVNRGGYRSNSFTSLHLLSDSLWLFTDESTSRRFSINLFPEISLECLAWQFLMHFYW